MVVLMVSPAAFGRIKNMRLSLFGGMNHVFEYGSEDDYVLGENNFPVTPAHTPFLLGAALNRNFGKHFGLELETMFILGSIFTLEDPSDGDTVEVLSGWRASLCLNAVFKLEWGAVRPYILGGGGWDKLFADEKTVTSAYGYDIVFEVPEKTIAPLFQAGGGVEYQVSDSVGLRLDLRYILVFDDPDIIRNLNVVLGVVFNL